MGWGGDGMGWGGDGIGMEIERDRGRGKAWGNSHSPKTVLGAGVCVLGQLGEVKGLVSVADISIEPSTRFMGGGAVPADTQGTLLVLGMRSGNPQWAPHPSESGLGLRSAS